MLCLVVLLTLDAGMRLSEVRVSEVQAQKMTHIPGHHSIQHSR